jgi:hypothetical protein
MQVTIYQNIKAGIFKHIDVRVALTRIQSQKSLEAIKALRNQKTKESANDVKLTLPCVCFSGKFGSNHKADTLEQHSGLIVLDFDNLEDVNARKKDFIQWPYTFACWISPSGKGLKVLVKIADGNKHGAHFDALKKDFPDVDKSGRDVSRLCFESVDTEIYINENSRVYGKIIVFENQPSYEKRITTAYDEIFDKLLKWSTKKGNAFVDGERNIFIFKMASACCRFGIPESDATNILSMYANESSSFKLEECNQTVKSAYRSNSKSYGTAEFSNDEFVVKETKKVVEINISPQDVAEINKQNITYLEQVDAELMDLYDNGYKKVPKLDRHYKRMQGELTVITGYGNMGKSSYWAWYLLMRALIFGERCAIFSPESDPTEHFYWEIIETFFGCDCTPKNLNRPSKEKFNKGKEWVGKHFFNVSPKDLSPTPTVIKEVFLSLIILEGVKSVVIDPFNQLANEYSGERTDKYLEVFLSECSRFAKSNAVNFDIIAHPRNPGLKERSAQGDYDCPDQFKIADGAMWNNKADNILVYHRPTGLSEPTSTACEIHSKKIRRQKIVGERGFVEFDYQRSKRRFFVDNIDPMQPLIDDVFGVTQIEMYEQPKQSAMYPNHNFYPVSSQDRLEYDEQGYVIAPF